jgi:DNA-binding transcriptional regulator YiaG
MGGEPFIHRNIRATRDRLGLTTAGLARLVGVHNRTAHRWLAGQTEVPKSIWRLLDIMEAAKEANPSLQFASISWSDLAAELWRQQP